MRLERIRNAAKIAVPLHLKRVSPSTRDDVPAFFHVRSVVDPKSC